MFIDSYIISFKITSSYLSRYVRGTSGVRQGYVRGGWGGVEWGIKGSCTCSYIIDFNITSSYLSRYVRGTSGVRQG